VRLALGVPFAVLQLSAPELGCTIQPLQVTDLGSVLLLRGCLRGHAGPRCGEPGRRAEATWPAGLFVGSQVMYLAGAGAEGCGRPLAVRSRSARA